MQFHRALHSPSAIARPRASIAAAAALIAASSIHSAHAQSLVQTSGNFVAADGHSVPGVAGAAFGGSGSFDSPVLDETGNVLFRAHMTGGGATVLNDRALFRGSTSANLALVIRGSDPAPSLTGITLNTAAAQGIGSSVRVSSNGRTFWGSSLLGTGVVTTNDSALFGGFAGSLLVLVREGDTAPGTLAATFGSSFASPSQQPTGMNHSGRVLFQSSTLGGDTTTSNNAGWWTGVPGSLELVQRKGDTVLSGPVVSALGFISQMNSSGEVLHEETLSTSTGTPPATTSNNTTLWVYTPGSGNALVVREGDNAPGTLAATFNIASNAWSIGTGAASFNNNANTVLSLDLLNGDVVANVNDHAIYVGGAGGLTLAVRRGSAAPGTSSNFDIANNSSLSINNNDEIAFQSTIIGGGATGATDTGIWAGAPGSLQLIAREGDLAPGTAGAFGSLIGTQMLFNDLGEVVFATPLVGGGGGTALYAFDPNTGLHLVVRGNDSVQVAPGVFKLVSSFGTTQFSNGDAASSSLSHQGRLALKLTMTDGTSAIVTIDIPSTPPPLVYCTAGTTTSGCNALISATANPSLSSAICQISVANVEGQKTGIVFYGLTSVMSPWGGGSSSFLCVKAPTARTPSQTTGGTIGTCTGTMFLDWDAYQAAHPTALGQPWAAGNKAYVQAWFRDPPAPHTTSLSNGVALTYQP